MIGESGHGARVLYLAHTFEVGGAEEMVLNLVRHLPKRFEPRVCCIHTLGPIGLEIRAAGVPVNVLGLNPGMRRPWDVARLREFLLETRPEIVHTFLLTASLYGRLAATLAAVPIIIGTEVNIYTQKRAHHRLAERLLMRATDRVVASAQTVREFYVDQVHADPAKVEVIYNAVDWAQLGSNVGRDEARSSLAIPSAVPVAGVIARLTEQKGHAHLFNAIARSPALATTHILVVGDGDLRDRLQQLVNDAGLAPRVRFLGSRRDLGTLLRAMDVFVLPSLWEGLPLSLILAMGAGVPVVATRVGGVPEVVEDGRTGLLVPPADENALAQALARVITNPAFGRHLADAARATIVPRFGVDRYVASVAALYDRLLAEST